MLKVSTLKVSMLKVTPTEKKNETKQNLFIYSITMFYTF